jgi:plasmid stability protein
LEREQQEIRDINRVVEAVRRIRAGEHGTSRDATARQIRAATAFGADKTDRLIATALSRADLRSETFVQNGRSVLRYVLGPARS